MSVVGTVGSLWRYPVKSMRGEELEESFVGFSGVWGDRYFAFRTPDRPKGFPYLTGREQERMLRFSPGFRRFDESVKPPNLEAAEKLAPGITPVNADVEEMFVDVVTPSGETLAVDDPRLAELINEGVGEDLTLVRSERAMTDCRPVSMISTQTIDQIGTELGENLDHRRFRANIYLDSEDGEGFGEDRFVGKSLRIGEKAVVAIIERDPRCKMISLDPDTGEHDPNVLRKVARSYDNFAGVYCAVLVEGTVRKGDRIELVD